MNAVISNLADYDNPTVKNKALNLTKDHKTLTDKIEAIFYYVRDDIKFQFPDEGDFVKASQTIKHGYGQCNNKTILFLASLETRILESIQPFSRKTASGASLGMLISISLSRLSLMKSIFDSIGTLSIFVPNSISSIAAVNVRLIL